MVANATAWIGYTVHQFGQWYVIGVSKTAKEEGKVDWGDIDQGKGVNSYAKSMFVFNTIMCLLKIVQSHVFYDGLAQTV